eukprot:CAMPEP_0114976076 /NCGR_PEP_ID=MMETSP0216-20121206/2461_1 /TAXON_ID=223996 /ORGANISM="Protocruzia adherens, Strain Boccale" /LENGTH=203 /DNA_ID=CAMNT_0002336943 /DNA_START=44 /DNA_END=655 /DNA_ORIENTATION=+
MSAKSRTHYDMLVKLLIIGDSGVGKTCFLLRFADNQFTTNHIATIGIDFKIKGVRIKDKNVKLQIWDTAGQERFRTITQTYYKGAMGIILVYDTTDATTFNNIRNWMRQIDQNAQSEVRRVIVANKCDLENKEVSIEEGRALAEEYGIQFFECSAKTGHNVEETFMHLANATVAGGWDQDTSHKVTVKAGAGSRNSANCCKSA